MRVACILLSQPNSKLNWSLSDLAEACLRWSPQIAIREPDVIWIEIGKCRSLYSETSFRARVKVLLRRFRVSAHLAVADDLPSALALAHYQVLQREDLPLEALGDFGDPFRTDPMGRGSIEKMVESLKRLGIHTIHQFKSIPSSSIPSRFGGMGLYCRQVFEDASNLPWPLWNPPEVNRERMELLPSEFCSEIEPLLFKTKEILDRLFSRLRGRWLRAERIRFWIELERYSLVKHPIREWSFELVIPQGSTSGFLPILRERLTRDLSQIPIESYVIAVGCEVLSSTVAYQAQRHFFHSREDYDEALGSLFGQLEEYLGAGRVFWVKTTEERFPEKSWMKVRLKDPSSTDLPVDLPVDLKGKYPLRPTRIFPSPVPITVIEDRIVFRGRVFRSIRWSCVERLSLDWLEDVPARNYYRVELEQGGALWVFSDPSHHFFVHGYFE